ncbi:MerR family DNA-binding transcriptional regulator [Rhodococcus sp. HNM0569]|uniref:MerR family DNA-binding transcriptional regulator n=1 Tax=Rhodococcus sp. HNM0569 TaxID=2716340 RepID=UPI00146B5BE7|nr:MerR family DNA-binding transcriptional regulator [Rhodococcus sp. HNM0569]NLU82550.1 MerR family DNA-binding transcriptional regulator [Rhodococcus sp. HNM0569]
MTIHDDSRRAAFVRGETTGPIGPQTMHLLERRGVVTPQWCDDGTARLSAVDADRIDRITELMAEGIALATVLEMLELLEPRASDLEGSFRRPTP